MRRVSLALLLTAIFASGAWARINKNDKVYLDGKIQDLADQIAVTQREITDLTVQLRVLSTQLSDMQEAQANLHQTLQHQGESLGGMLRSINLMRERHSADMGTLADRLNVLSGQIKGMVNSPASPPGATGAGVISPAPPLNSSSPEMTQTPAPTKEPTTAPAPAPIEGYVTAVHGGDITVGLGSDQGLHVGSKLTLYKRGDPQTQAGELEVTSIVDGANSHARIVTINKGVQPEFSDIVRPK